MSAFSGGWSDLIKFIVDPNAAHSQSEFKGFLEAIIARKCDFTEYAYQCEPFLSMFSHIVTDQIVENLSKINIEELDIYVTVSKILLEYLIRIVNRFCSHLKESRPYVYLSAIKDIIISVKTLCTATKYTRDTSRQSFNILLNKYDPPPLLSLSSPENRDSKIRQNFMSLIQHSLSKPLYTFSSEISVVKGVTSFSKSVKKYFIEKNENYLQILHGGEYLIDLCLLLPTLAIYFKKYESNLLQGSFPVPANFSEAHHVENQVSALHSEIEILFHAMSVNVMEPLNDDKLRKLTNISGGCLYCSAHITTMLSINGIRVFSYKTPDVTGNVFNVEKYSDEDFTESISSEFVEKSMQIFGYVQAAIKSSTRAHKQALQNNLMNTSFMLICSMSNYMYGLANCATDKSLKQDKGKISSKMREREKDARMNWIKTQQLYSNIALSLLSLAISSLSALFDDIAGEPVTECDVVPARLSITQSSTALERIARVFKTQPNTLIQFLVFVAPLLYRKACSPKRLSIPNTVPATNASPVTPTTSSTVPTATPGAAIDGDTFNVSDLGTYYEDDLVSCSNEESASDEDDDSEPILGHWFEETILSANEGNPIYNKETESSDGHGFERSKVFSLIPEKGSPVGYVSVATDIFTFLNNHIVSSDFALVQQALKDNLSDTFIVAVAAVVRDLDREAASIARCGDSDVIYLYKCYSISLMAFVHNLLTRNILDEALQNFLLTCLGVSPFTDATAPWPMMVHCRSLSVLAQVLLSRNNKESACVIIWNRVLHTLRKHIICKSITSEASSEGLNIEHAQILMFFFNSLSFMQKKTLLLTVMEAVIEAGNNIHEIDEISQYYYLARLLLFFEYMVKYLYDPPDDILEQVQYNITGTGLHELGNVDFIHSKSKTYSTWKDIASDYWRYGPDPNATKKHPFYDLSGYSYSNQETPKLDGLALNFMLNSGSTDSGECTYTNLLSSLSFILQAIDWCKLIQFKQINYETLCAIRYCVSIGWRLLLQLPPSVNLLDKIMVTRGEFMQPFPLMLYVSFWGPRCNQKLYINWLKDILSKQGHAVELREMLLRSVSDITSAVKYNSTLVKRTILSVMSDSDSKGVLISKLNLPNYFNIMFCDVMISKFQVLIDDTWNRSNESDISSLINHVVNLIVDSSDTDNTSLTNKCINENAVDDVAPLVLQLIQHIHACIRSCLLHQINECGSVEYPLSDLVALGSVISVAGYRTDKDESLLRSLPDAVHSVIQKWANIIFPDFNISGCINVAESFALSVMNFHMAATTNYEHFSLNPSLKHLLHTLVKFVCDHIIKMKNENGLHDKVADAVAPLLLDVSTASYLRPFISTILTSILGDETSQKYQVRVQKFIFQHIFTLLLNYTNSPTTYENMNIHDTILYECMTWIEQLVSDPNGRLAIQTFFDDHKRNPMYGLQSVLISIISPKINGSKVYILCVLQTFNKLFSIAETNSETVTMQKLMECVPYIAEYSKSDRDLLFYQIIIGHYFPSIKMLQEVIADLRAKYSVKSGSSHENDSDDESKHDSNHHDIKEIVSKDANVAIRKASSEFLEHLTIIVRQSDIENKDYLAYVILESLVPVASDVLLILNGCGFDEVMKSMISFADIAGFKGHILLFKSVLNWIGQQKIYLHTEDILVNLKTADNGGEHLVLAESICYILNYLSDVLQTLCSSSSGQLSSLINWDADILPSGYDLNNDWSDELYTREENDDAESAEDDSDEDNLFNKLCTFTITQKEFMNQHWYHCHTCKMIDKVGVCSICARVCHKGHDVTYAKYGNFFCDCGAKNDGFCLALTKRSAEPNVKDASTSTTTSPSHAHVGMSFPETAIPSPLRKRVSSRSEMDKLLDIALSVRSLPKDKYRLINLAKQLEPYKEEFFELMWNDSTSVDSLLSLCFIFSSFVETICAKISPVGCHKRAKEALDRLHHSEKSFDVSDKLMVPTIGSQEGAFESIRLNFSGDQGQTIRQLISANLIHRVSMCCLSSPQGKRQHLVAVSHEKNKVTVYQLNSLLKQVDSSKKKLTLTRLSSTSIPFTILSVTGNPCNEDYLAVCGLKECHVLTFNSVGAVADHIVLHPQLETANFIIRAIWLPGSQTCLALVTADFVKIYELSKDILSPQYYFLVPSGKIRDVTFVCREKQNTFIIIMSSFGYVYIQEMNDESSASLGSFFVTNTLKVEHPGIKDSSGLISLGGVSIYYSHVLKILFFSFAAGKSFMAFLSDIEMGISKIYEIYLNSSAKSSVTSGSKNSGPLGVPPLYQWTEIVNHPGLVCSVVQSTNNPVVLMIKPDNIMIQEIKVVPAKSKIMDKVLIRHSSLVSDNRTTLLLLCEDGSLRIYTASMENTGYWLSPEIRPLSSIPNKPSNKKSKSSKLADQQQAGSEMFPVDFFEHCTALTDIEFGGNDVLQIYNTAQLKTRLNTPGLYIVSTKQGGFSITAINNDSNMIITGIRVLVGVQDPQKSPSYVDVYGRLTPTASARNRWFDIPLTRVESLMSDQDKRITILFGQSTDPECITIVNSIKVYGKTKEQFGCLEDAEEVNGNSTPVTGGSTAQTPANDSDNISNNPQLQITHLDKLMCSVMNVLENCFNLLKDLSVSQIRQLMTRSSAITLSIRLMNLPTSFCIQLYARALLAAMHKTRQAYHSYKDTAMLINVFETLVSFTDVTDAKDLDPELFYHIILTVRGIAVPRPQNIVKFALPTETTVVIGEKKPTVAITGTAIQLLNLLVEITWRLHEARPSNSMLPAICVPGLAHVESTVFALVEIIHAFAINDSSDFTISMIMKLYIELLLHDDVTISFAAKTAIISVLKPKLKQKKPILNSCPPRTALGSSKTVEKEESPEVMEIEDDTEPEAFSGLVHSNNEPNNSVNVQEILNATNGYPPVDLLDDVPDEEAMVELAIALSMQEHGGEVEIQEVIPDFDPESLPDLNSSSELHELHIVSESQSADNQASNQETGHLSDTTASASAAGSDDEGSTAAVDENARASSSEQTVVPDTELESEKDAEMNNDLHKLRIILLERFISHLSDCKPNGGLKIIPFFQVLYALTSDLSTRDENYISILDNLLNISVTELGISNEDLPYESYTEPLLANYSAETKYHFILLKFLSVLLNNVKSAESQNDKLAIIAEMISNRLHEAGFIKWALHIHKKLLPYWKSFTTEDPNIVTGALLKPNTLVSMPDISPFYLKQSSKANVTDIFELYPQLLTELMVRIPYQIQKYSTRKTTFDQEWFNLLCDYMMTQQTPFVKRSVRKLLLHIGPSKDSYRQRRDNHALESHLKEVFEITGLPWNKACEEYPGPISLPYDQLLKIVEHLKASVEVAFTRTSNWRKFLLTHEPFISHLFILSCALEDSVASLIIQLLQYAICAKANTLSANGVIVTAVWKPEIPIKKETTTEKDSKSNSEEVASKKFLSKIRPFINDEVLSRFMSTFVLETNSTYLRYQAHFLLLYFFRFSDEKNQDVLEELAWNLWPKLPTCGRKAYLYIDLLGYFTVKCSGISKIPDKMNDHFSTAVRLLRSQNQILMRHSNSSLYSQISQYVEMEGFYLESEPCMVCNNPEVPYSTTKLQSIKADSKFTTNSQIIKLISSHTINRINLRISDLKRTKMVRTIILYYNNRCVQAAVELKNKPALWHKAKKISLLSAQTEVKIDFPLPIVACNLMIEYVDFYENLQSSSENLTCPRCSASVPSSPGICNNCGENVFQCHKCRAINYDEKDPFLCHVCGFCKYAKFDYTLTCRPVCAIEPIMNDEDRRKVLTTISVLLEKADRLYKQLTSYKPVLESLLSKISEHRIDHGFDDSNVHSSSSHSIQVNKTIQLLAQKYCTDCKNSFDELSKIIQKILVCRRELVAYDQKQLESNRSGSSSSRKRSKTSRSNSSNGAVIDKNSLSIGTPSAGRCYGCASFVVEHCITILRAVCLNVDARKVLRKQGLIHELVEHNLRRGSNQLQEDVRQLLCILVRDSAKATEDLCSLLFDRISTLLKSHVAHSDLPTAVRPEIVLLGALIQINDSCWEQKARCIMKLFLLACKECKSPIVLESVILPCLCIIQSLIQPEGPKSKKYKDKNMESLATVRSTEYINIDLRKWLQNNDNKHTFKAWKQRTPLKESSIPKPETRKEVKGRYLMEKCFLRWKERSLPDSYSKQFRIIDSGWIKPALFNSSSRQVRLVTSSLIYSLCDLPARKKQMLDILTSFLGETSASGQYSSEFLDLYQLLIKEEPWKIYVTLRRVLTYLADLISKEIQTLHELEGTTLTSDMSQGYVLKKLVELISSFFEVNTIKRRYKGRLVGSILNGYLSLRRLVIQRTRIIDETQEKLLELLEGMTTGTEAETRSFMAVCIATVDKCSMDDIKTPVFIFERLCSIIFPEENEVSDFYLSLEKDPQQEDFLQGRMLGNPYSSSEPGLGPLMRDVKNKICQDCELIALLEDDNGMELLVNNKIISLDLPVKLVYKKIWLAGGAGESEPMRVIYRMRGLLGDATEEFIETLNSKTDEEVNNEEVYKLATTMGDCGGLHSLLKRLDAINDLNRYQELTRVCLKLLSLCVKVKSNQDILIQPEMGAMRILLDKLKLCLETSDAFTDSVLSIIETLLSRATSDEADYKKLSNSYPGSYYIKMILQQIPSIKSPILSRLMHVAAALTYGNDSIMKILTDYFLPVIHFEQFDADRSVEDEEKLDTFCILTAAIDRNSLGNTFKNYLLYAGFVDLALDYITRHAACLKSSYRRTDSDEWKNYISRPALKYIIRYLTGLAYNHTPTQLMVSAECISIIHRLEQVSSDEHVGTLAENLLEALRTHPKVASRIENVREQTKAEKKRLAMAMREKQLGALGMRTNEKGQVTAETSILQQLEELGEETGLVCVICREGYRFQPNKVLGIYTFTKRCPVEEFENKTRKTLGYSTVTHFNVIHIDCHMSAVRQARTRDEWESAMLQNGNTKCNGLLPLWGPQVTESAFASCLARHNSYLQECTGHRDVTYTSSVHDLKLLLLRFAREKSFHEDTGGGGPQSNMNLIPYLMHLALYVINATISYSREEKSLMSFLESNIPERWIASAYETEGPFYWLTFSMLLQSPQEWQKHKITYLRRLIVVAHVRHLSPSAPTEITDLQPQDYSVYKSTLVFFGLVNMIYKYTFKKFKTSKVGQWSLTLAEYIRFNDEALLKSSEKLMSAYENELLGAASFEEYWDLTEILDDNFENRSTFVADVLKKLNESSI